MIDEIDRKILNLIQEDFPLTERPFKSLGEVLNLSEEEIIERVKRLKEGKIIRRIGPVIEKKGIGYVGMLCGAKVEEERIEEVAKEIAKHRGVTHCYEREGELNLWFTIITEKEEELENFLETCERRFNIKIYRFPEKRVYKIKTYFPL